MGRTGPVSPYYPALSHPVFRKVLPGTAASALGDGMSAVAIAWLAIELAPLVAALAPAAPARARPHGIPLLSLRRRFRYLSCCLGSLVRRSAP